MMLRKAIRPFINISKRSYGGLAAADDLVRVTFLDHEGKKHQVAGREGMSLLEVSQWYGLTQPNDPKTPLLDLRTALGTDWELVVHHEDWKESIFGEGPTSVLDHVVLPVGVYNALGAPEPAEVEALSFFLEASEQTPTSRLASRVVLDKSLDGIVISVPEPPPQS